MGVEEISVVPASPVGREAVVKTVPVKTLLPSCSAVKVAYCDCFNRWYNDKFVTNQWDKEECFSELEAYRACVTGRKVMDFMNDTGGFRSKHQR